jgi:hypothetical protein
MTKEKLELSPIDSAKVLAIEKAAELAKKHLVNVYPIVFEAGENDFVIGYIKEPSRLSKYRFLDKASSGIMSAAAEVLDLYLIKEESDSRIYSNRSEDDEYNMGAAAECGALMKVSNSILKKN